MGGRYNIDNDSVEKDLAEPPGTGYTVVEKMRKVKLGYLDACRSVVDQDGKRYLGVWTYDQRDIKMWVLRWGSRARVIDPPSLREEIRREAEMMAGNYKTPAGGKRQGVRGKNRKQ